jgi:hypothetical protein
MCLIPRSIARSQHYAIFRNPLLLKSTCLSPQWLSRAFSDDSTAVPQDIAILGGGISGLTTAVFLLMMHEEKFRGRKTPKITIYESSKRLGGWMHTKKVVPGSGKNPLYIEQGPRTIRCGGIGAVMLWNLVRISRLGTSDSGHFD